jgi:RNA polymerase sigma factor (sigma-70 family)
LVGEFYHLSFNRTEKIKNLNSITEFEQKLIAKCKKGKLKYQEMLYKHYYSYGMSIALRYSYNPEETVEILNDSFLKVFNKIHLYNEELSFKAWIRKIIIHTSIDYYRKSQKYAKRVEIEQAYEVYIQADAIDMLSAEDILGLLNELPQQHRLVFNLYEIEGYSHDEIAEMLHIQASSSRSFLTRAKQKLRILCQNYFQENYERPV